MVSISACVIVKNEEENLPNWLKCMNEIADELIIVDTGSTDNTKKIAKSFSKVKLYDFKWCNDFAAAKNFAIDKATGDWILLLDADECFLAKDNAIIRKNIELLNDNPIYKIIMFERLNIDKETKELHGKAQVIRVMRNDKQLRYKGKVHEQLFYDNKEITDIAIIPEVVIYHTGYSKNIIEDKLRRNLKIMQEDININGENSRYYAPLADCYYGLGEYEQAIIYARKFIDSGLVALGGEKQVYYTLLAAMEKAQYPLEEIEVVLTELINKFPDDKVLLQEREWLMNAKNIFISACVIVKNEEKNIENYLKRIKAIADEIIVVDTGSTDNTVKLAKENGVFVYSFKWINDFSAAKNFALDKAKGKWIIFLDADEYFKPDCIEKLISYIKQYDKGKTEALACKFLNIDCDKDNEILSTFYQLRVFRNDKNIRYKGQVHEALYKLNDAKIELVVLPEEIEVIHTGYSSSIMQKKTQRNLNLLQKEIAEKGKQPQHDYYLADCYYSLGDYEKTIFHSRKFIASGIQMIGAESNIYTRLIDALSLAKHPVDEILAAIELAVAKFPQMPDFYFMKSFFLLQKKDYKGAEQYLNRSFKYWHKEEVNITLSVMEHLSKYIYLVAGIIAEIKGLSSQAISFYIKGLEQYKYNKEVLDRLYRLTEKKPIKLIINMLEKIYVSDKKDSEFIIQTLSSYNADTICIYYKKKLGRISVLDRYSAEKNYVSAAEMLKEELADIYKNMMMNCIEKPENDKIRNIYLVLPNQYQNVLKNAFECFK